MQWSKIVSKLLLKNVNFFSLICDETTTIDCQTWISIHVYVVKEYVCVPMLLTLERVTSRHDLTIQLGC